MIFGHMLRIISSVCYLFLRRNGTLTCEVSGTRRHLADLPQGGLEISRTLLCTSPPSLIGKVQKFLQHAQTSGLLSLCKQESELQQESSHEQPEKKCGIDSSYEVWLQMDGLVLSVRRCLALDLSQ